MRRHNNNHDTDWRYIPRHNNNHSLPHAHGGNVLFLPTTPMMCSY